MFGNNNNQNNPSDEKNKNLNTVVTCLCTKEVTVKKGVKVACPNCNRTLEG